MTMTDDDDDDDDDDDFGEDEDTPMTRTTTTASQARISPSRFERIYRAASENQTVTAMAAVCSSGALLPDF